MKKTIKAIAFAFVLSAALTAVPALSCSAYSGSTNYAAFQKEVTVDFVILAYKNNSGELTITGCYDYDPDFTVNPYTNGVDRGFIALCVVDGMLEIPSEIDGKTVTEIKNVSGSMKFNTLSVPDTVTKITVPPYYAIEFAEETYSARTLYC